MKKKLKLIRINIKILFCFSLLFLAFLLFIAIIVVKPQKLATFNLYNVEGKTSIKSFSNKIEQYIYSDVDKIQAFHVYLDDDSITKCDFHIEITDENKKSYFSQDVSDYNTNVLYLNIGEIYNTKNKIFKLVISTDDCSTLKAVVGTSVNKKNHLAGLNNKTLKITVDSFEKNNSYYWYCFVLIAISLLLMPLARSEKNEKK